MSEKIWLIYTNEGLIGFTDEYLEAEDYLCEEFVKEYALDPGTVITNREIQINLKFGMFELHYLNTRQNGWYVEPLERLER